MIEGRSNARIRDDMAAYNGRAKTDRQFKRFMVLLVLETIGIVSFLIAFPPVGIALILAAILYRETKK